MIRRPPRSTRTDTLFPYTTLFRSIVYNKDKVDPSEISTYEDLADPKWKGKVCIRSSSNIYNLSLMASLIEHHGEKKAEEWAKGVVANFARPPKGGDTDQIRAVAAGECHERSEEHTSELQSLMRISYAVFCLKKKKITQSEETNE